MVINSKALEAVSTKDLKKVYTKLFYKAAAEVAEDAPNKPAYKIAVQCERELKRRKVRAL